MKRVIVTAHPDDEVLWCGGLPIRYPGDWTIICCSIPRRDPVRAWKFYDACEVLGAKAKIIPVIESEPDKGLDLAFLNLSFYDHIFTHNKFGEYGHFHHRWVHNFITAQYPDKKITTFGYRKNGIGEFPLVLTDEEFERKMKALQCYNHILPYRAEPMPKWRALLINYPEFNFKEESYDGAPLP